MSEDILHLILAEVRENRAETRKLAEQQAKLTEQQAKLAEEVRSLREEVRHLSDKTERLTAVVDRVERDTDKLIAEAGDVKVRLQAIESAVAGNLTTVVSQSHRLDSLDLRMRLIEKRLELRDAP